MKKAFLFLMIISLLSSVTACGENADIQPEISSYAKENTEAPSEEAFSYLTGLPVADYNGYKFRICGEIMRDHYDSEELDGEVINDAIYRRNHDVEEKYNISIEYTLFDWQSGDDNIKKVILAGENAYDLLTCTHLYLGDLMMRGSFLDWKTIPYVDMTKIYYVQSANDTYSISTVQPLLFGDYLDSSINCTWVFVFNKRLADQYGISGLYETVDDGRWTIDYLTETIKDTQSDLNGDSVFDENDFYGLAIDKYGSVDSFVRAFEMSAIKKDENNYPILDFYNEHTVNAYTRLYNLYYNTSGAYTQYGAFAATGGSFIPGKAIFSNNLMITLYGAEMRDMQDDYGILPYPKLEESQSGYYSYLDGTFSAMMLGITTPSENIEMCGMITEALNAYSREYVLPALYDTSLKLKASRDEDSMRMLDILLEGRRFSFDSFDEGGFKFSPNNALRANIQNKKDSISSFCEKNMKSAQKWVDKIIAQYENVG